MQSRTRYVTCLFFIFLPLSALAQHAGPTTDNQVDIQVKVTYEDGRTPVPQVKLELLDNNGVAQNLLSLTRMAGPISSSTFKSPRPTTSPCVPAVKVSKTPSPTPFTSSTVKARTWCTSR